MRRKQCSLSASSSPTRASKSLGRRSVQFVRNVKGDASGLMANLTVSHSASFVQAARQSKHFMKSSSKGTPTQRVCRGSYSSTENTNRVRATPLLSLPRRTTDELQEKCTCQTICRHICSHFHKSLRQILPHFCVGIVVELLWRVVGTKFLMIWQLKHFKRGKIGSTRSDSDG